MQYKTQKKILPNYNILIVQDIKKATNYHSLLDVNNFHQANFYRKVLNWHNEREILLGTLFEFQLANFQGTG